MKTIRTNPVLPLGAYLILLLTGTAATGANRPRRPQVTRSREYFEARGLFEKLWESGEASPAGGDGVVPLYHDRPCVGCHHLGRTGAGDNARNVTIPSALPGASLVGNDRSIFQGELEDLRSGFRNRGRIVLHRHSALAGRPSISRM